MAEPLVQSFDPDALSDAPRAEPPALGDLVEVWEDDRSVGLRGRVAGKLGPDRLKVRVEGVGAFSVPVEGCIVLWRAQS